MRRETLLDRPFFFVRLRALRLFVVKAAGSVAMGYR
jgi:hypothetical protein